MCDCEAPECISTEWRKARKEHRCIECHVPIAPGELYEFISGIWDGEPDSYKTCRACAFKRKHIENKRYPECGPCFGDLVSEVREDHYYWRQAIRERDRANP